MKINPTSSIYKSSNKNQTKTNIQTNKKQQRQKSSDKFIDILKSQIGKDTNNNKIKK